MIECVSYIPPNYVTWEYSADGGATWTELDAGGIKSVKLTIESVAASDAGMAHIVRTLDDWREIIIVHILEINHWH